MRIIMTYGDRTFCSHAVEGKCSNKVCSRFFSEEDHQSAVRWWGSIMYPLSISDMKTDKCGYIVADVIGEKL